MAGNIQKVNLANFKKEVGEYTTLTIKISNEWYEVYKNMSKIPTYWTGKLANKTISVWNNNLNLIETNSRYFQNTITDILLQIVDQYQAMENGKPFDSKCGLATYPYGKQIPLTDESTIKFDKTNVETILKNIESSRISLNAKYNDLINRLDSMQGYSDSLKTLSITYKEKGTELKKVLQDMIHNIKQYVADYVSFVNTTESGFNEEDVKRAK